MVAAPGFDDSYLHQDKWIAARARKLGLPPKWSRTGHPGWEGFRGDVSLFLWRLRPEGAQGLKSGQTLSKSDFL